jgi:hypothetical protein
MPLSSRNGSSTQLDANTPTKPIYDNADQQPSKMAPIIIVKKNPSSSFQSFSPDNESKEKFRRGEEHKFELETSDPRNDRYVYSGKLRSGSTYRSKFAHPTKQIGNKNHFHGVTTYLDVPSFTESETSGSSFDYISSEEENSVVNPKLSAAPIFSSHDQYEADQFRINGEQNNDGKNFQATGQILKPITKKIEVSPGEFLQLRGAKETWKAIKDDFYMPCACIYCDLTLLCIQDAEFVLCPSCHVVTPLEGVTFDGRDGGVGMGFTIEELAQWQGEIRTEYDGF